MFSDSLTPGLALYGAFMMSQIHDVMREWGAYAQEYMKSERPWQDRTTNAREGLGFSVEENPVRPVVHLFHSVSYGEYLELRWGGEYAIIMPTIEALGPELIRMIEDVI